MALEIVLGVAFFCANMVNFCVLKGVLLRNEDGAGGTRPKQARKAETVLG